jgi:hypothetical protein
VEEEREQIVIKAAVEKVDLDMAKVAVVVKKQVERDKLA